MRGVSSSRTLRLLALLCALASGLTSLRVGEFAALAACGSGENGCCGSADGACCCGPEEAADAGGDAGGDAQDPWTAALGGVPAGERPAPRPTEPRPVARDLLCGCGSPGSPASPQHVHDLRWLADVRAVQLDLVARGSEPPRAPWHARRCWRSAPEPPPPRPAG